jgi:ABC-type branched-subunit amino acid transport system substrate-binding protein
MGNFENKKGTFTRRDLLKALGVAIAFAVLLSSLVACTPNPISATTTTTTTTTVVPKTLTIGFIAWFGSSSDIDWLHSIQLLAEVDNKNGGIIIGKEPYNIEIISYDTNNEQATEVAAINRLVYQDNVKFIIAAGQVPGSWLPATEENKVIVLNFDPSGVTSSPKNKYIFNATGESAMWNASVEWFCSNYSEKTKTVVRAFPDNLIGHIMSQTMGAMWKTFGVTPTDLFYPTGATDLSSLGTKVVVLNPTLFTCAAGDSAQEGTIFNAVYDAGYRGAFFNNVPNSAHSLSTTILPSALEGFICPAYSPEFDPPLTQSAIDFKTAWIAKYGQWTSPEVSLTSQYLALKTALQQAATIDTEKVATVMAGGMKYETLNGVAQMMSRPDIGNNKTVDSVVTFFMKQLRNSKPELMGTVNIDEVLNDFQKTNPPLPPGATLPAGPPPGAGGPPPSQ